MYSKQRLVFLITNLFIIIASSNSFALDAAKQNDLSSKIWYNLSSGDLIHLDQIDSLIQAKDFKKAQNLCSKFKKDQSRHSEDNQSSSKIADDVILVKKDFSKAVCNMVLWYKFSSKDNLKDESLQEISKFINENQFFDNIEEIQQNAAQIAIDNNLGYDEIAQFFALNPPLTKEAKRYLLNSKIDFFNKSQLSDNELEEVNKNITREIVKIWIEEDFNSEEQSNFLQKFKNQLNEKDHIDRISRLIFDEKIQDAKRIISFVSEDYQKLFKAAIDITIGKSYINNIILSVPRNLRSHEVLLFRRILWYKVKDEQKEVVELLLDNAKKLQYVDKWWGFRRLYARELLKSKDYDEAYDIISNHNLPTNHEKYWEAEWTSGWIALRFLDKPKTAYRHFSNLYNNVSQPVSLARATYWLGRSMEADDKKTLALRWYHEASSYPLYFYGQVAINKYQNLANNRSQRVAINLPDVPQISPDDLLQVSKLTSLQIAYVLLKQGKITKASSLLEKTIMNCKTPGQIVAVMQIVNEFSNRALEVKLARTAAKKNVFFVADSFQILEKVKKDPNAALIHAIIRQESGFATDALSSVGAVGYMQVMPDTARLVAKELRVGYSRKKLSTDVDYNIKIGSHYIKTLVDKFEGSEILAIAAYNAGPNNAIRWVEEFYDPRDEKNDIDKVIDWIELITYYETRNYVQRIMENVIIYKYLLSQK